MPVVARRASVCRTDARKILLDTLLVIPEPSAESSCRSAHCAGLRVGADALLGTAVNACPC